MGSVGGSERGSSTLSRRSALINAPWPPRSRDGRLLVVSGPSGVGKTTVVHALAARHPLHFSVSVTTRAPRLGEHDGVDYRFVTEAEFDAMRRRGDLLEWAEYSGYRYGTPRGRGDTDPTQVARRLIIARWQLEVAPRIFDRVVVNDDVAVAVDQIVRILEHPEAREIPS